MVPCTRPIRSPFGVEGEATGRSVLDALEVCYPMLRGTIRDQVTQKLPTILAALCLRVGSVP